MNEDISTQDKNVLVLPLTAAFSIISYFNWIEFHMKFYLPIMHWHMFIVALCALLCKHSPFSKSVFPILILVPIFIAGSARG